MFDEMDALLGGQSGHATDDGGVDIVEAAGLSQLLFGLGFAILKIVEVEVSGENESSS